MAHELQKMIDGCASKLIVPMGQHVTGTLHLKSNMELHVETEERVRAGIMITGTPGHKLENIRLQDIDISFPGGGTAEEAQIQVPEDETRYPEQFFFGTLPSWGAYIRHARNVEFHNVNLQTRKPDEREKFVFEDVEDFCER